MVVSLDSLKGRVVPRACRWLLRSFHVVGLDQFIKEARDGSIINSRFMDNRLVLDSCNVACLYYFSMLVLGAYSIFE
jgi:hypothetical protein